VKEELRISIECHERFQLPARYTLAMLALMAGRRVRFVDDGADLHYGSGAREGAAFIPASPAAAGLTYAEAPAMQLREMECRGQAFLSLFPCEEAGELSSDIVAAAFRFFSLHEEWTTVRRDVFGRFQAADSLLGTRDETDRPVVAEYARAFALLVAAGDSGHTPDTRYRGHRAAAVMTHDIDYLSKFTPGLLFREVVKNFVFNRRQVSPALRLARLREYLGFRRRECDPYITSIQRMLERELRLGIVASWLFKAGGNDKRDVSYSLASTRAREMLALLREAGQDIGLHPSFNAHADAAMLAREAARLRAATGTELRSVRQHYLRFVYPLTWRQQAEEGFMVDSTLGFAEREGFRNGLCHPFLPWDLEQGRVLPIWELPLTVMDGTLAHYRGMNPESASARIVELLDTVAAHAGVAVLLFHNTSYDGHDFPGWGGVFEDATACMADGRFLTASMPEVIETWLESAGYASTEHLLRVINSVP
jgi:hypothetical protein